MTFFTNSKKYAKKIKKAEKCVVYENTVRELFSCEQFKKVQKQRTSGEHGTEPATAV